MSFTIIDVQPDTDEWLRERRGSIGASEAPAVMNMSAYGNTPLDVYKAKQGLDREFDPVLGFIGHASEPIMHEWVERFSGLGLRLLTGFMARSVEHPFLHATFDRVTEDGVKVQMKTAHQYAGHHWDEGVPTDIRVQVQAELAVSGDPRALVVVWIGGREFRHYWEPRDDRFIRDHLLPTLGAFWHDNVLAGVTPDPSTTAELNEMDVEERKTIEVTDTALEAIERRAVLLSDAESMVAEADALKVAIGAWMGDADTVTKDGRNVLTFRYQKGRAGFDQKSFREAYPQLHNQFVTQGSPFRVMRTVKQKEQAK
ncbi:MULTISPECIES: YqaJ viral recombinase family protein [unclassified Microbacterium]|uniref:YqaJ viral recombinase family nuclease n=1 Tax=unclassified Microbacterium TaxID=2609290 RepID=UPI0016055592|nr:MULTISPECIES: YqaJ viral recombinase family protein [unclassified Microbacterium]QNA93228.1 recombinase [Microbacterium sp. Se63.02b]QYM63436.1 YqaJ viral recombinase family protein [Microbacterium sp. Se5.02b]